MKNQLLLFLNPNYWKYVFSPAAAVRALLSAFGILWLLIEISGFFFPGTTEHLKQAWWAFAFWGVIWALWDNRPIVSIRHKLIGRDVWISICVGDLFEFKGAFVVGSNTSFDTEISRAMISPRSVQGQFTSRYYDSVAHLDADIEPQLDTLPFVAAPPGKPGKARIFPVGTVAKVYPKNQTAYFVALATINEHGNAQGTLEDLQQALANLWEYLSGRGSLEPVVTPVLGSGYSRITAPREALIREIVKSFIAANTSSQFTNGLIIAIPPKDYAEHGMDLRDLGDYLRHMCRYSGLAETQGQSVGSAVRT